MRYRSFHTKHVAELDKRRCIVQVICVLSILYRFSTPLDGGRFVDHTANVNMYYLHNTPRMKMETACKRITPSRWLNDNASHSLYDRFVRQATYCVPRTTYYLLRVPHTTDMSQMDPPYNHGKFHVVISVSWTEVNFPASAEYLVKYLPYLLITFFHFVRLVWQRPPEVSTRVSWPQLFNI